MSQVYPKIIYARIVGPGTNYEYMLTGPDLNDVSDGVVGDNETLSPKVARYALVGTGEIHHTAPRYVEDTAV